MNHVPPENIVAGKTQFPRPRAVTLLALGVLTIASLNLLRWVLALSTWDFLSGWPGVSPLYLLLTGLIWSLVAWPVGVGLWKGKPWAPRWARGLAGVYTIYFWLERLFLYDRPAAAALLQPYLPNNWVFLVGLNLIGLVMVYWILVRPKTIEFFGDVHEQREH